MQKKNTPETVGNPFGYLSQVGGKGEDLQVGASVTVSLAPDGTDATGNDTEWDAKSPASCNYGWQGRVGDFAKAENFEEGE
jgi:hypothetical protein